MWLVVVLPNPCPPRRLRISGPHYGKERGSGAQKTRPTGGLTTICNHFRSISIRAPIIRPLKIKSEKLPLGNIVVLPKKQWLNSFLIQLHAELGNYHFHRHHDVILVVVSLVDDVALAVLVLVDDVILVALVADDVMHVVVALVDDVMHVAVAVDDVVFVCLCNLQLSIF